MALMTGEQYIESIRKIPMEIYMFGKKVENPVDNPILRPSLNSVRNNRKTYTKSGKCCRTLSRNMSDIHPVHHIIKCIDHL